MQQQIAFDDWTLDPVSGELSRGGKTVRLQEQVLQLLLALLERPNAVVTHEELISRLWPHVVVDYETSLKSIVRKLRLALGDDAERPRYIETLPRKGYRFVGQLAEAAVEVPTAARAKPALGISLRWLGAVGMALLLALAAALALRGPAPQHVRLAVLPFENLSPDPENAFFADGLHEEILASLASGGAEMDVISRTTMMSYRMRPKPVTEIASELGVTHVLEGSVRRENADVRVSVQLVDARADRPLWSQSYDRTLASAMTLQLDVANAVAAQLVVKLSNRGNGLPPSANPAAYDLYLKALVAMRSVDQRTPAAQLERIEQWLSAAIALDDAFAAAYVQRAQIGILRYVQNHDVSDANKHAAQSDLETARRLAGDTVAVVQARSRFAALFESGPDAAVAVLDTPELAVSKDPAVLLWRAFFASRAGRSEQGLALYAEAAALDPGNASIVGAWERELWGLGRPADALAVVRDFNARGLGHMGVGDLEFAFTGRTARLRADLEAAAGTMADDSHLLALFDLLRIEGKSCELDDLVQSFAGQTVRVGGFREYGVPGTGVKPVAELSAWASLLCGDRAAAAEQGRRVEAFVASQTATRHNAWHLRMLEAEAALFVGDRARAVEETRAALELTPHHYDFLNLYSMLIAARTYAWAGVGDAAVDLLETLAAGSTTLGPAEIARDPFFTMPLAGNPRFRKLANELEKQIERNQALF